MNLNEKISIEIRPYRQEDEKECQKIVRAATMSTVNVAFIASLKREISLQLVVLFAAVFFVFGNLPPSACLLSLPVTAVLLYLSIYAGHVYKAYTLDEDLGNIWGAYMLSPRTVFWVAEAVQRGTLEPIETRHIIGTCAVITSNDNPRSARLRRMVVIPEFQRFGVASALIDKVVEFCRLNGYSNVELVTTECHEGARQLYMKKGFELRQLYNKQIIGSIVTVQMSEYSYQL